MKSILILLLFLLFGYIVGKIIPQRSSELWSNKLNWFVINISLPALVFAYMISLEINKKLMLPAVSAWGLFIVSILVALALSKTLKWSRSLTAAVMMLIALGNTSFLGIPFTQVFFGDAGVPYAIIYDQLGSFLVLSSAGIMILSIFGNQKVTPLRVLYKVLTFPSIIALALAMLIKESIVPEWIMNILQLLAYSLTPLALVSIGLILKLKIEERYLVPFVVVLGTKMVLAPLSLFLCLYIFDMNSIAAKVSILEAGMAPMISSAMMTIAAGIEKKFVASVLGYGIMLSFATLPLIHWLSVSFL